MLQTEISDVLSNVINEMDSHALETHKEVVPQVPKQNLGDYQATEGRPASPLHSGVTVVNPTSSQQHSNNSIYETMGQLKNLFGAHT